jgi:anti-repressor protein
LTSNLLFAHNEENMQEKPVTPRDRINGIKALLGGEAPAPANYPETDHIPDSHVMSSKVIADLTGKAHKNVIRDIRAMVEDLKKDGSKLSHDLSLEYNQGLTDVRDARGYTLEFMMARPMVELLVTGYSTLHRAKALSRLRELEGILSARNAPPALPNFDDPIAAAEAWILAKRGEREAKALAEERAAKIAADAPKVEFSEAIRSMDGENGMNEVAKSLGIGRNTLMKQMRKDGILMKGNEPYQRYIDRGLFVYKAVGTIERSDGRTQAAMALFVTGAGYVFLQRKYAPKGATQLSLLH